MKKTLLIISIITLAQASFCDQEAGNSIYVTGNGARYAKCIPSERYGTNGVTRIFLAQENEEILEYSYNWYSPREVMFHRWLWGLSVVRFGPGPRGQKACKEDLALAFYDGQKLMASYSTLDIAGNPTNVQQFVSHYTVIQKVHGYRQWSKSNYNEYVFDIETIDGRMLTFHIPTGKLIGTRKIKSEPAH